MTKVTDDQMLNIMAIIGPTACGKTKLAVQLAHHLQTSIISADSRQVYRGMDIGTGKDLEEYNAVFPAVKHHLIDVLEAGEKYSVFDFQRDCLSLIETLNTQGETPILCGGTGLYLDSILLNYNLEKVPIDEDLRRKLTLQSMDELRRVLKGLKVIHNTTDTEDKERLIRAIEIASFEGGPQKTKDLNHLIFGIRGEREALKQKIELRLKLRLENGLLKEVEGLIKNGLKKEDLIYYGLEYKFVGLHLYNDLSYNDMFQKLRAGIFKFSKKQMTWFRRMEKLGLEIHWLDMNDALEVQKEKMLHILNKNKAQ